MEQNKLKKQLKYNDWIVWISFVMMLLVKFITIFQFVLLKSNFNQEIQAVATAYEANELFRMALSLGNTATLIAVIILPASAMAFYYYMRRRVIMKKVDIDTLTFYIQFAFFTLLINIVNDLAGLIGLLAKL